MRFKYSRESEFSTYVVSTLRRHSYFVQRIETGYTGRGVPDIYCISPQGKPYWIELKRCHKLTDKIPWRPGQLAWMKTVYNYKQTVFTLVCFDDTLCRIDPDGTRTYSLEVMSLM